MENIEIISIPAIVAIVCAAMQMLKKAFANESFNRWIPLLSVLLGAASGWATTGAHQTGKQLLDDGVRENGRYETPPS